MAVNSLIVVGAGELGCRVAELWKSRFPDAIVTLKTRSFVKDRSDKWRNLGFESCSRDDGNQVKAPFVLFCAPPSSGYKEALPTALGHWDGKGLFVFTSSGGSYTETGGGEVDEESAVKHSEYYNDILEAEKNTINSGGCVLRLGGLYTLHRGAHNFWLKSGKGPFSSSANCLINLIHYDDAAQLVVDTFLKPELTSQRTFLVSDGVPISSVDICKAALKHPAFQGSQFPTFLGPEENKGKRYNSSKIRTALSFSPKITSFELFMSNLFVNEKKVSLLE